MAGRREIKGAAEQLTLNANIDDTVASLASAETPSAGWPTSTDYDFVIVVGRNTATPEKMLVSTRSGASFSNITRGYDDTTGVAHSAGAHIEHCVSAETLSEANAHVNDDARDDHSQYLNTTRHDVEARHTFGAAFGTPASPAAVSTAAGVGSGDNPAREDHVHALAAGVAGAALSLTAGVLDVAVDGTTIEVAADALALKADAVTGAKIADDAVNSEHIADGAIDLVHMSANSVDSAQYVDGSIDTAHYANNSVTGAKLDPTLPLGLLTPIVQRTSNRGLSTTPVDHLTSGSVTTTEGRIIRITCTPAKSFLLVSGSGGVVTAKIYRGSTQIGDVQFPLSGTGFQTGGSFVAWDIDVPDGTFVYKCTLATNTGTGTAECSSTAPGSLEVFDTGVVVGV